MGSATPLWKCAVLCLEPVPDDGGAWVLPLRAAASTVDCLDQATRRGPGGLLPISTFASRILSARGVSWMPCPIHHTVVGCDSGACLPVAGMPCFVAWRRSSPDLSPRACFLLDNRHVAASLTWEQRLTWLWAEVDRPDPAVVNPLGDAVHLRHVAIRVCGGRFPRNRREPTLSRLLTAALGAPQLRELEICLDGDQAPPTNGGTCLRGLFGHINLVLCGGRCMGKLPVAAVCLRASRYALTPGSSDCPRGACPRSVVGLVGTCHPTAASHHRRPVATPRLGWGGPGRHPCPRSPAITTKHAQCDH